MARCEQETKARSWLKRHNNPQSEAQFFKSASESNSPSKWLEFSKREGYFEPQKLSDLISSEDTNRYSNQNLHVCILNYLISVATENEKSPDEKTTVVLKDIIKENCDFIKDQKPNNQDAVTKAKLLEIIGKLPIRDITVDDISHVDMLINPSCQSGYVSSTLVESTVPNLLQSNDDKVVLDLFKIVISEREQDSFYGVTFESILADHWLEEFLRHSLEIMARRLPLGCLDILIGHISALHHEGAGAMFNAIPDIEGKNDKHKDYPDYLIQIAKALLDSLKDKKHMEKAIALLEKQDIPTIRRILFYAFAIYFEHLKDFIWEKIRLKNPLEFNDGKREVYRFFEINAKQFSKSQVETILQWIKEQEYPYLDNLDDDLKKKHKAYRKKEWLMALKPSKDKSVQKQYEIYDEINPEEIENPGYAIYYGGVSRCRRVSPYAIELLKELSVEELAEKVNGYKAQDSWQIDAPSKEGLASVLQNLVEDDCLKYAEGIEKLLGLDDPLYIYYIFCGLRRSHEKAELRWDNFLKKMLCHIRGFEWQQEEGGSDSSTYKHLYLKEFFWTLKEKIDTCNDSSLNPTIEEILLYSLNHYVAMEEDVDFEGDIVTLSINTMPGVLLEATMSYLLPKDEPSVEDSKRKWEGSFKELFTKKLYNPERDREFSATLGKFFVNLSFLDADWVWSNFNKILPKESNDLAWKDTMSALLFHMDNIYDNVYKRLKESKNYSKALDADFYSEEINSKAVEHICAAYLFDLEKYEGSLLKDIVDNNNIPLVKEVIWHFGRRSDIKGDSEKQKRVRFLWKSILDKYEEKALEDEESKEIVFRLIFFQKHFDRLGENLDMLKKSFACSLSDDANGSTWFCPLEIIQEHVDQEASAVCELILCSIDADVYFYYKEKKLKSIVTSIYEGDKRERTRECADKICNSYTLEGIGCLREIYERYNHTS